MPTENHYDTLQVSPKASAEVIRAAYKSLMQRHHPDKQAPGAGPVGDAAQIARAYAVLSDPPQRLAYDRQWLAMRALPPMPATHARNNAPTRTPQRSGWFAWVLIVCIVGGGWAILRMTKKPAAPMAQAATGALPAAPASGSASSEPLANRPAAGESMVAAAPQVIIVSDFVTDLSVQLSAAGSAHANTAQLLHIPALGFQLSMDEPARWAKKIEAQRPQIIRLLLARLADARYLDLIASDGDLYLKAMIEDAVAQAIELPRPAQNKVLTAMLPQSYTVR